MTSSQDGAFLQCFAKEIFQPFLFNSAGRQLCTRAESFCGKKDEGRGKYKKETHPEAKAVQKRAKIVDLEKCCNLNFQWVFLSCSRAESSAPKTRRRRMFQTIPNMNHCRENFRSRIWRISVKGWADLPWMDESNFCELNCTEYIDALVFVNRSIECR